MAKEYVRKISATWWTERPSWRIFMLREATSLFVGLYAALLICLMRAARDPASFHSFYEWLRSPGSVVLHVIILAMAVFHTVTWFVAAPKALRVFKGDTRVPDKVVVGAHYGAWIAASLVIAWLALG